MLGCLPKFLDRLLESARRRPSGLLSRDASCNGEPTSALPCPAMAVLQGSSGVGPCQRFALGQMESWDGQQVRALGSVRLCQGLCAILAACGISAWHCDPIACAQDPVQASPGITPWEQERRAPALWITEAYPARGWGPVPNLPLNRALKQRSLSSPRHIPQRLCELCCRVPCCRGLCLLPGFGVPPWHSPAPLAGGPSICISPYATSTHGIFMASPGACRHRHQLQLSQQTSAWCFLLQLPWELCQAWLPL